MSAVVTNNMSSIKARSSSLDLRKGEKAAPAVVEGGILSDCFWVFLVGSVAGLLVEEVYHLAVFGELQDRAGLIFGPFSPIYGVGALAVLLVSRVVDGKGAMVQFLAFAVAGGTVEFAASYLMQALFGLLAWDYSGTFLSIAGRTNGQFMLMWGVLGVLFRRYLVPLLENRLLPAVRRISPLITRLAFVLISVDVVLTLVAFDCWFMRADGNIPETTIQKACAIAFDDEFMASRFETMSLFPQDAAR